MSVKRKILLALLLVLVAIQFIRPAPNRSSQPMQGDIASLYQIPLGVHTLLKNSCYNCHSNNTSYPWYANVQPFGWLLADHIRDGKAELNFNEFAGYSQRRRISKLKAVQNSIKDGSMPLPSYTWLHSDARLSKENKELMIQWTTRTIDSLSSFRRTE